MSATEHRDGGEGLAAGSPATQIGPLNVLLGGADPAAASGWEEHPPRMGFFTDTSVCIGCKACEVA